MEPSVSKKRRTMTRGRLMVMTLGPISAILIVILGINLATSSDRAIAASEREMAEGVQNLSQRFDGALHRVAQVAEQTAGVVGTVGNLSEQEIYGLLENGVNQDPLIYGAAMAFAAGAYDSREAFCPYVYRDGVTGTHLKHLDIAGAYDYLNDPEIRWWHDPATSGRPVWSEPYFDEGAGNIMMSTYSVPFFSNGTLRGITTVDIPLKPLQAFIGTDLYVTVITPEGRFIHRSDGIPDGNPSIFELYGDRPDVIELAQKMIRGETGKARIVDAAGENQLVYFAPLPSTGWAFAVYLPEAVVLADARRQAWWLAGTMLASLLLIAVAMWIVAGLVMRTQDRMRQSEHRFRRLIESAPDAMVIVDADGRIVLVNDQAERTFGYAADAMIGQSVDMLVPERYRAGHAAKVSRFFSHPVRREMGGGMELRGVRSNGTEFPIEVALSPLETARGKLVSSVIRDITERHEAAARLAEAEERHRLVLESTSEGIFGVDAAGKVMFINRAAARLVGYTKDELLGQGIHDLIHHSRADGRPYPVEECPMHAAFTEGISSTVDDEVLWRKDGGHFDVEYSSTPLRKDGKLVGAVIVFRDITDRKVAEAQLRQARDEADAANRAKSAFLANMSHELRTPMNAILGYSEMLTEDAEDAGLEDFIPDLKKINQAGTHLLALINDVLDLSKIEAGKLEAFPEQIDVDDMLDSVVSTSHPLMEKNSNKFLVERGSDLGDAFQDLTKIRQTLFNLLSNAAKFTREGTITLRAERTTEKDGDWFTFSVTDTGIGIPEDKLESVFEEFTQADGSTTRDYGGTGLGLTISRKFCRLLGGDLTLESGLGEGSTFTMHIPATLPGSQPRPAPAGTSPDISPAELERLRQVRPESTILVIDDDPEACEIIERYLRKDAFGVVTANSGAEGLRIAHEIRPAAITLDVMMPDMDGWAVLQALKADPNLRHIPVIMLSMIDDRTRGYSLGAVDYLTKPVDREQLHKVLARYYHDDESSSVLLIEDDPETRQMMARTLVKAGWTVAQAGNGREALSALDSHKPRLILLDLMMPVMDGFEFLAAMRSRPACRGIPVIVVTAKDLTQEDRARLAGNVEAVLEKNAYTRGDLLERIREAVASEAGEGATGAT